MLTHPKIANNITDLIGRTPLLRLNKVNPSGNAEILLKLESMEPCSSVKVRLEHSLSFCCPNTPETVQTVIFRYI
jgi:cysteine synthase